MIVQSPNYTYHSRLQAKKKLSFKARTMVGDVIHIDGSSGPYDGKIANPAVRYGRNAIADFLSHLKDLKRKQELNESIVAEQQSLLAQRVALGQKIQQRAVNQDEFKNSQDSIAAGYNHLLENSKELSTIPPTSNKVVLKYLPEENVNHEQLNKQALMGATFELLGKKVLAPVDKVTEQLISIFERTGTARMPRSAKAFANDDNTVTLPKAATSLLLKDMESVPADSQVVKKENINGTITPTGERNFFVTYLDPRPEAIRHYGTNVVSKLSDTFKLDEAAKIFESNPNNLIQE